LSLKWNSIEEVETAVVACRRCRRLRQYCLRVAKEKKREFRDQTYWGLPIPGLGDRRARCLIIGLAPAAHGANRTGRMFTGDSSGRWLFRALYRAGFSNQETGESRDDGLRLRGIYIGASARCAPPDNKPLPEEIANCQPYLDAEYQLLQPRLIIALGAIAFETTCRLLERHGVKIPRPKPKFGHDRLIDFGGVQVLASFHPSRQNTQTGKLTEPMWEEIFQRARKLLA